MMRWKKAAGELSLNGECGGMAGHLPKRPNGGRHRLIRLAAALFLCGAVVCGCKGSNGPVVETAEANLTTESQTAGSDHKEAESSKQEAEITRETAPEFEEVEETVYVTGDQVNLREGCSAEAEVITRLDGGTSLKRIGKGDKWSKVIYQGREAYISSSYVSADRPKLPEKPISGSGGGKIIAIDAGHQAKGNAEKEPIGPGAGTRKAKVASGATGVSTGLPEYELTLSVSRKLKAELEVRGYQTVMIRETNDVNISNAERAEIANESGADIFIRVHANSLDDGSVHGTLTMCQTSGNPYNGELYPQSSSLSKKVAAGVSGATGFKNRGVQETDTMSGINWCKIPVTIVEMGFMSNVEEDEKMATEDYQNRIARGIADGIDAYYER